MKKLNERISGVPARKGEVIVKSDGQGGTVTVRNTNAADRQGGESIEDLRKGRDEDKNSKRAKKLLKAGKITKTQYEKMISEGFVSNIVNRIKGRRRSTARKLKKHGRKMHGRAMTLMGSSRTYDHGRNLYWKAAAEASGVTGLSSKSHIMSGKKKFKGNPSMSLEHNNNHKLLTFNEATVELFDEGKKTDFVKKVIKRYGKSVVGGAKTGHMSHSIENDQIGDIIPAPTRYAKNIASGVGSSLQDTMSSHSNTYKNIKRAKKAGHVKESFLEKLFGKDLKDIKQKDKAKSREAKEKDKKDKSTAANYERSGHGGPEYDVETGNISVGLHDNPTKKQTKDYSFAKKNSDFLSGASKVDPLAGVRTKKTPAIKNPHTKNNIERMNFADNSQAPPGMNQKQPRVFKPVKKGEMYKMGNKAGETLNDPIPTFKEAMEYIESLIAEGISEEEIVNLLETPEFEKLKKTISDYNKPDDGKRYWDHKKVAKIWRDQTGGTSKYAPRTDSKRDFRAAAIADNQEKISREDRNIRPAFEKHKKDLAAARKAYVKEGVGPWTGKVGKKGSKNLLGSKTVENGGKSGKDALDSVLKKMDAHYANKKPVKEEIVVEAKIKLTPGKKMSKKEFAAAKAAALAPKPKKEMKKVATKAPEETNDLDLITQHAGAKQIRASLSNIPVPAHRDIAQKYVAASIRAGQGNKVHGFVKDPHGTLRGLMEKKPKSGISLAGPAWSKT